MYKNIVESKFPLSLKLFFLECIRMGVLAILLLFFISLSEILFYPCSLFCIQIFSESFLVKTYQNIENIFLQKKTKIKPTNKPFKFSAWGVKPRIKIPPMAAVTMLTRMSYLIPSLTLVRDPLNLLSKG